MKNFKKVLSLVLAVVMVMGALVIVPTKTNAAGTYTKVTDVSTITSSGTEGKTFVVVAEMGGKYYAMNAYSSNWVTGTEITIENGEITSTDVPVMTIKGDATAVQFETITGTVIYGSTSENKLFDATGTDRSANWVVSEDGETDTFKFFLEGSDATPRYMAFNGGSNLKFRQYKESTITGQASNYDAAFLIYEYSGTVEVPQDIELGENATPEEIVNAAYEAMEKGVNLLGTWSLTGVITAITDPYEGGSDYKNVALTIQVGDMTDKLMGGYRVSVADTSDADALAMLQGLAVGDTVKLTGTIGYYGTTVQFVQGSTIELVAKAEAPKEDITLEADATPEEIVNAAYQAMADGVHLLGDWELTGVITGIDTAFNSQYNNITVTMQIGEMADKKIQCFRLAIEDATDAEALAALAGLGVGDTITVVGSFGYYNGKVQYNQGCLLTDVVKAAVPKEDIELDPETATEEDIVDAAYQAMADGVDFLGTWELTGVITSIDTVYSGQYKNITVTMQIGDMADKLIQCYRLTVEDKEDEAALAELEALAVGDTITVSGTFGYYNGKVQYNQGCVVTEIVAAESAPDTIDVISTGAGVVLVAGIAALAIIELKKRR